jgi:hypothetical protein
MSAVIKSLKRAMAGEYSRELSTKVFAGQCRLITLGYRQGGTAGYGLRRLLLDQHGQPKTTLARGERKSLQTERVILTPGPDNELGTETTAATIVSELGSLSRFQSPSKLMGYSGLVAREHSGGNRVQLGGITKTGNSHLRRVLVEAAWAYQHRPNVTGHLLRRQKNLALSEEVKKIAWKGQQRLHKRYQAFAVRGRNKNQIVTALGRELLGFIWAIALEAEKQQKLGKAA